MSVVVLNWNVAELLAACLSSLRDAAGAWWPDTEVIVVDNASTDGSVEMVRARFPGVQVIALPTNLGFAGGNNAGIRAARGEYIFLLNPDTIAHPGSIATLADYMQAHEQVGIAGPRLLNPDGTLQPSRRRFPTLAMALIESTPMQRGFPNARPLRQFYMLDRPDDETQQVGWLSGAALMCRKEALEQAGLFDPGYFMFSEEVDLCRRVSDAGWGILYLPEAEITHYGGQSTGQNVPARHVHFNTSKARYFRLHEGRMISTVVRRYMLLSYAAQLLSEAGKWLLGHKRPMRDERVRLCVQVLQSGLRERKRDTGRKTRVLLITGEYPPARGGVGDYTCKLHLALEEKGVCTRVLTRKNWGSGIRDQGSVTGSRSLIPFESERITLPAALRALRGCGARIAHVQYQSGAYDMRPTINLLPLLLKRLWGGSVVVTFHDLRAPYLFPKAGPLREWANRLLARTADAVIATNPEDAARLASWGVKRVRLVPIGSNIADNPPGDYNRAAWRAARNVEPTTTLLAYFGFLNSTKGLDDLLCALVLLREQNDPSLLSGQAFRLMMVGGGLGSSDPTNRATATQLDALARELGVQDALLWTGYLSPREVSAALRSADIAVLPYSDGASFRRGSLLAALEHGLPVVSTRPVGTMDDGRWTMDDGRWTMDDGRWTMDDGPGLVDGENVLLVAPGDVAALAEGVGRLGWDDELRAKLSIGARDLARSFSWERIAEMHEELYTELITNGASFTG